MKSAAANARERIGSRVTTYVLDASAVIRYIDDEVGAVRVEQILKECAHGRGEACLSAVQWGEIAGNLRKRFGAEREAHLLHALLPSVGQIVPATGERAVHAAQLKVDRGLGYADAFALELAMDSPDHLLVTADYGFKVADNLARIEFLPAKE